MIQRDFIVIGGGPAGMSAAITAAECGVHVTLIDENPCLGGQIFRQMSRGLEATSPLSNQEKDTFARLRRRLNNPNIEFLPQTTVWGIFDDRQIATDNKDFSLIRANKLLIADGVYETPMPFPGWTLPGVMALGSVQILLKSQGVIPEGRVLLAGTGPFLYLAAAQLLKHGVHVVGLLEAASKRVLWSWGVRLWHTPHLALEGWRYLATIKRYRVPIFYNTLPIEACGQQQLQQVVVVQVDHDGTPKRDSQRSIQADYLCLNYGFTPSSELTHLARCEHRLDPELRGWIPILDTNGQTSQPGVFAAGDCIGVGGVKTAVLEGELAGLEVSRQLGWLPEDQARVRCRKTKKALDKLHWYKAFLSEIYTFKPGMIKSLPPDTLVCRCEEVDLETITRAIQDEGTQHLDALKRSTRAGMGRCQGRYCYPTLIRLIECLLGNDALKKQTFSARPPVRPIPLKRIAEMDVAGCQGNSRI